MAKNEPVTIKLTGSHTNAQSWMGTFTYDWTENAVGSGGSVSFNPAGQPWGAFKKNIRKTIFVMGNESWLDFADAIMPGFGAWLYVRDPKIPFHFGDAAFFYAG